MRDWIGKSENLIGGEKPDPRALRRRMAPRDPGSADDDAALKRSYRGEDIAFLEVFMAKTLSYLIGWSSTEFTGGSTRRPGKRQTR